MAARKSKSSSSTQNAAAPKTPKTPKGGATKKTFADRFSQLAVEIAHWSGKPLTFTVAVALVLIWGLSGPLFGFSDTWQLVINTSTTIITFLMVFLIQNTQNRDTLALQIKLAELIVVVDGAKNRLATAEDMSEEDLEKLHAQYQGLAETTFGHLEQRRSEKRSS